LNVESVFTFAANISALRKSFNCPKFDNKALQVVESVKNRLKKSRIDPQEMKGGGENNNIYNIGYSKIPSLNVHLKIHEGS